MTVVGPMTRLEARRIARRRNKSFLETRTKTVNSPRQGSKLAVVLALLGREASASIGELPFATGLETR
jgi:hypothetical protein